MKRFGLPPPLGNSAALVPFNHTLAVHCLCGLKLCEIVVMPHFWKAWPRDIEATLSSKVQSGCSLWHRNLLGGALLLSGIATSRVADISNIQQADIGSGSSVSLQIALLGLLWDGRCLPRGKEAYLTLRAPGRDGGQRRSLYMYIYIYIYYICL